MQYQVPQFIETEQKIIGGKLTLKQFIILSIGGAASIMLFFLFNKFLWVIFTVFIGAFVIVFFIKINVQQMTSVIGSAFLYYWNPTLYLWRGESAKIPLVPTIKTPVHRESSGGFGTIPKSERAASVSHAPQQEPAMPSGLRTTPPPGTVEGARPSKPAVLPQKPAEPIQPQTASLSAKEVREKIAEGGSVQNLWEKINTSKLAVPKREKPMNPFRIFQEKEHFEVLRKATGEKEVARRIDYK